MATMKPKDGALGADAPGDATSAPAVEQSPAVPAAPATVTLRLDQLNQLVSDKVAEALKNAGQPVAMPPSERERIIKEAADRDARLQAERDKKDAELLAGPQQFDCSMTGERMMNRRVGGSTVHEARAKYMDYFGIIAIMDPKKQIIVDQVNAA